MTLELAPAAVGRPTGAQNIGLSDPGSISFLSANLLAVEARLTLETPDSRAIELIAKARAALAAEIGRAVRS